MKGNIESQLAEDFYNNVGVDFKSKGSNSMELNVGYKLTTKNVNMVGNAVVYNVRKGGHRTSVTVLTDYGNILKYPSVEDVLEFWNARPSCLPLRERIELQIKLLTDALEGLNNGN